MLELLILISLFKNIYLCLLWSSDKCFVYGPPYYLELYKYSIKYMEVFCQRGRVLASPMLCQARTTLDLIFLLRSFGLQATRIKPISTHEY